MCEFPCPCNAYDEDEPVKTMPRAKYPVFKRHPKRLPLYRGFVLLHAEPGGGPVQRGESSWRTVCGALIANRYQIQFRRLS